MAEEITNESGKRAILTKVKEEPISDDEVICEPVAKSPKRSDQPRECVVKKEPKDDIPVSRSSSAKIKITIKATKEKHAVKIFKDATVKELKDEAAKAFKMPVEKVCLIYSGKLLKDSDVLSTINIEDGHILHLVIKTNVPVTPNIGASPFGLGAFGGLSGLGTLGLGSPNFLEVQQQMQKELLQNPELLQQVMNNPFVQSMMENPEYMRQIITSNPQMKEMLDKNPELSHMLNSPDVLRSTMEVAKNPIMLQELIRFRVENMQTPSGSQTSESKDDKEGNKSNNDKSKEAEDESKENKDESEDKDKNKKTEDEITSNLCETNKENKEDGKSESSSKKSNKKSLDKETTDQKADAKTEGKPSEKISVENNTSSTDGGIFTSPGLQSIMQQMVQNPQLVQEMFNAPYMQSMMDALASNPEVANQIMVNNPVFGNNAAMQDQMRQSLPAFIRQMQNPEVRRFVSNPQALSAMMNIHQGLDQLQQAAPNVFNMFPGQPPMPILFSQVAESNRVSTAVPEKNGTQESNIFTQDPFSYFMRNMVNSMSQGTNSDSPPEEKYRSQLEQMRMMGFANQQTNIQALIATFGDVNSAIERILSHAP